MTRTSLEMLNAAISNLEMARSFAEESSRRRTAEAGLAPDAFACSLLKDSAIHHGAQATAFWQSIALLRCEFATLLEAQASSPVQEHTHE